MLTRRLSALRHGGGVHSGGCGGLLDQCRVGRGSGGDQCGIGHIGSSRGDVASCGWSDTSGLHCLPVVLQSVGEGVEVEELAELVHLVITVSNCNKYREGREINYLAVTGIDDDRIGLHCRVVDWLDNRSITGSSWQTASTLQVGDVPKSDGGSDVDLVLGGGVLPLVQDAQIIVGDVYGTRDELTS